MCVCVWGGGGWNRVGEDMGSGQGYRKQSFSYVKQWLNLIYIAIKFRYDIPKGYRVMGCAKIVLEIILRNITQKISKGEQPFV